MSEPKLFHQALQALSLLQRIEVLALDVFNERHGCGSLVGHIPHQHRNRLQTGQTRGAKAPFASNDLVFASVVALGELPHQNGLHDALRLDGLGQLVQRPFVHARSRLVNARHHLVKPELMGRAGFGLKWRIGHFGAQQSFQSTAKAFGFFGDHGHSFKRVCKSA